LAKTLLFSILILSWKWNNLMAICYWHCCNVKQTLTIQSIICCHLTGILWPFRSTVSHHELHCEFGSAGQSQ